MDYISQTHPAEKIFMYVIILVLPVLQRPLHITEWD